MDLRIIRNTQYYSDYSEYSLSAHKYANEILRPHVIRCSHLRFFHPPHPHPHDNARPRPEKFGENMLKTETVQCMEGLAFSPDLNPIEHVLIILGQRIAVSPLPPLTPSTAGM